MAPSETTPEGLVALGSVVRRQTFRYSDMIRHAAEAGIAGSYDRAAEAIDE